VIGQLARHVREGHRIECCWHQAVKQLAELPPLTWYEIGCRLRCTRCNSLGYVNLRVDWSELIDFSTAQGREIRTTR